jgi:hypothetical protein
VFCDTPHVRDIRFAIFVFVEQKVFPGKSPKYALSVGIALDHRRTNLSEESLQANIARLQEYKNKLIVFPKGAKKRAEAKYKVSSHAVQHVGEVLPLVKSKPTQQFAAITKVRWIWLSSVRGLVVLLMRETGKKNPSLIRTISLSSNHR